MSIFVKICGITNISDAFDAIDCGADCLGFNFYPDSSRFIDPIAAVKIIEDIPSNILKTGVFVNAHYDEVADVAVALNLDFLQFHGDETAEFCNQFGHPWWKAFRLKNDKDLLEIPAYESDTLLVDSYVEKSFGGTGVVSNWDLAVKAKKYGKLILSGGLKPDNIELALETVRPYGVDVASGVETSPGVKDFYKLEEFISRVKSFTLKPHLVK